MTRALLLLIALGLLIAWIGHCHRSETRPVPHVFRVQRIGASENGQTYIGVLGGLEFRVGDSTAAGMRVGEDYRFWLRDGRAVVRVDFMPPEPIDGNAPYGYPETEVVPPK